MITATIGPHGPHILTTIIAVLGVFAMIITKKLGVYLGLAFMFMAYFLHETIFHFLFIGERYFQGLSATVSSIFWSNLIGTDYAISFAFIGLGLYIFRKRLHLSYPILLFASVCSIWILSGLPTTYPLTANIGPATPGLTTSLFEESYTISFMLALWKSFR